VEGVLWIVGNWGACCNFASKYEDVLRREWVGMDVWDEVWRTVE